MDGDQGRCDRRRRHHGGLHAAVGDRRGARCSALGSILGESPIGLDDRRLDHRLGDGAAPAAGHSRSVGA